VSSDAGGGRALPAPRLPDFFIVGHHKSGTTALYEMLRRHPEIYMSAVKEPRFFDTDLHPLTRVHSRERTLDEYLSLFAPAEPGQRAGEASPSYLRSSVAAAAIAALAPASSCIAILREPASFVRSMHSQLVQERVESELDLRRAVQREEIVRDGRTLQRYSDHIHYAEQLRRYHDAFPAEQVLVLIYDDFRRENDATVRRVLRFLDVDDSAPITALEANPSVDVRSPRLDGVMRNLHAGHGPVARAARATVKTISPQHVRWGAFRTLRSRLVYSPQAAADEQLMSELRRRYRDEVVALSEYLDRDLVTLWGYDRLD